MKNSQILEQARKQAGIADGVRVETFAAWKRAGMSVRKGEKAAFSAKINCKYNGSWCMTEKAYFTADQVEPLTARPSRRGKDTAPVSEPAPAVAVPSVAVKETETAPAPVAVELAPVVPVVAPSNPTRPLIKAGDDQNGTYFGITSDGTLVTIATYESHDLSIERVDPSVSVQTETAPVVDAPADPDPVEEEEPAPVLSEPEKEEPALSDTDRLLLSKSDRPFVCEYTTQATRLVTELKRDEIRSLLRCFGQMYNELREKQYFADMERLYTRDGIAPQTEQTWHHFGFKLKKDAAPCHTYREYIAVTKTGTDVLTDNKFIDTRKITGIRLDTVNYYAWDQVEPNKRA